MAQIATQQVPLTGIAPAYQAATGGGDFFVPATSGIHLVHIKNGGGVSVTVTLDDPTSVQPASAKAFNPDVDIAVPNAGERIIAVDPARFRNSAGQVNLAYSGVTSVTVAIFTV